MDTSYGSRSQAPQQNIPPLNPMASFGSLTYGDGQLAKIEIQGTIDKGFFLAENEWTCYRRNYFSCICSFSLNPYYPNQPMQYLQAGGGHQPHQVYGFAMSISAVVADNESHAIELVQHTPKRDKGPIIKPDRMRLTPKSAAHSMGVYGQTEAGRYDQSGFVASTQTSSYPTEHTFERIQFKQATANNGKRRAAQQYYHLVVELWADVGAGREGSTDQYIKIAQRKSAKMIVRGRSPGHYQGERRGSSSSGPGSGPPGSIGGTGYSSSMMGTDYTGSTMLPGSGSYTTSYDPRPGYGGNRHHHELTMSSMIAPEEEKVLSESKGYQYFPHTLYESEHDAARNQVELFSQARSDTDSGVGQSHTASGMDLALPKVAKAEMEGGLPSLFYSGPAALSQRFGRFDGKPSSTGFYPTPVLPHSSTMNMT